MEEDVLESVNKQKVEQKVPYGNFHRKPGRSPIVLWGQFRSAGNSHPVQIADTNGKPAGYKYRANASKHDTGAYSVADTTPDNAAGDIRTDSGG